MVRTLQRAALALLASLVPAAVGRALRPPVTPAPAFPRLSVSTDLLVSPVERALWAPERAWESGPGYWDAKRDELLLVRQSPDLLKKGDVYVFPFRDRGRISSGFGPRWHPILKRHRFHRGWDLPRKRGTPVYASGSGRVEFSGWRSGYGHAVIIRHNDGRCTLYGHLSVRFVKAGDWVVGGQGLIGRVGSSGLATGAHLHFEVRDRFDRPVDPAPLVRRPGARTAFTETP